MQVCRVGAGGERWHAYKRHTSAIPGLDGTLPRALSPYKPGESEERVAGDSSLGRDRNQKREGYTAIYRQGQPYALSTHRSMFTLHP